MGATISVNKGIEEKKSTGFLGFIERVGNKMPHPLALFLYIIAGTMGLSFIVSLFGVSAVAPSTGQVIEVKNLLSLSTLMNLFTGLISNFQKFPVLGIVVVLATASGFAERVGLFKTIIEMFLKNKTGNSVVFIAAFVATMGNLFGDSAFLVVPLIISAIFKGLKRHPVAGLILGYAAVGGGYGSGIIPNGVDIVFTNITVDAAKLIDPNFDLTYLSGFYFTFISTFLIAISTALVTIKVIEPKLGKYVPAEDEIEENDEGLTPEKIYAAKRALQAIGLFVLIIIISCIPQASPFRSPEGSLIYKAPLMSSIQTLVVLLFFIPAIVYSRLTKQVTSFKDLANHLSEAVKGIAPFIVLAIVISQFLVLFAESNLGTVLAIKGGDFLKSISMPQAIICFLFLILVSFINLFIISGSAKYLIFGPIFVPMFMQLGIHPSFTQVLYRMGDAMTNHLSPLNAFFVILLTLIQKYDKKIGMGTIFSYMIPYSATYFIVITIFSMIWFFLGLTPGIGGSVFM